MGQYVWYRRCCCMVDEMVLDSRRLIIALQTLVAGSTRRAPNSTRTRRRKLQAVQIAHRSKMTIETPSVANGRRRAMRRAALEKREETTEIFGMRPIDYSVIPPICHSPPPPPIKPARKVLFPVTVLFSAGVTGYFYVNNNNDNLAYWRA